MKRKQASEELPPNGKDNNLKIDDQPFSGRYWAKESAHMSHVNKEHFNVAGKTILYKTDFHRIFWLDEAGEEEAVDGWTTTKPKFDREFSFATAHYWKDHWEYKIWQIVKVDGPEGWYYGLCEGDGEEWGDHEDLQAQLYYILPEPK